MTEEPTKEGIAKQVEKLILAGTRGLTTKLKRDIETALKKGIISREELNEMRNEAEEKERIAEKNLKQQLLPELVSLANEGKMSAEEAKDLGKRIADLLEKKVISERELQEIATKGYFIGKQKKAKEEMGKILKEYFSGKLGKAGKKAAMGRILKFAIKRYITFKDFEGAQEKLKAEKLRYGRMLSRRRMR